MFSSSANPMHILVWAMSLYLEEPDREALASEALTDGPDDKKIDFIQYDPDHRRVVRAGVLRTKCERRGTGKQGVGSKHGSGLASFRAIRRRFRANWLQLLATADKPYKTLRSIR